MAIQMEATKPVEAIKAQLKDIHQRNEGLRAAKNLSVEDLKALMPELVSMGSYYSGRTEAAWELILKIPKEWLVENIERYTETHLRENDPFLYEIYRANLGLYLKIDHDLTRKLAERAAAHSDPDVQEAGTDFLDKLNAMDQA